MLWCPGLLECRACSHVQADMQLTADELREYYGHKYFHGDEYVDYAREKDALALNFRQRLDEIKQVVPEGSRLFEIGCAYGYFLQFAAGAYQVSGCDISEHAIAQARQAGLDAQCADYLQMPAPDEPFQVVCMWDTIEHLSDPKSYVTKACGELVKGGMFVASTGDAGSRLARFRREKWRMVHPPTHLHYFTSDSIRRMLELVGFSRIEVTHDPFYRNLATSLTKVKELSKNPLVAKSAALGAKLPGLAGLNIPINTYDLMTVRAWK